MAFLTALADIGIFLAATGVVAVVLHRKYRAYWIVNVLAATVGAAAFLTVPPMFGRGDPFDPIAAPAIFAICLALAALIGTAVRTMRRTRQRITAEGP
jgi:uncharacterized membrane protein HdeD (DUF308 family)